MLRCWSIAYSSAMRTGSLVVISVVAVLTTSLLVVAAMNASSVVGAEEKNGGLWCSPIANTSSPTSSVFCAIWTIASIRSASLGVSPETGSRVMSLTEKIPNCMSCLSCPSPRPLAGRGIYAFACISAAGAAGIFRRKAAVCAYPRRSTAATGWRQRAGCGSGSRTTIASLVQRGRRRRPVLSVGTFGADVGVARR